MAQFIARPHLPYAIPFAKVTASDLNRFVNYEMDSTLNDRFCHRFCGPQQEPVAYCPNCEKPLIHFASLNTRDPRLQFGEWTQNLPLLFCWRCNVGKTRVDYHLTEDAGDIWYTANHKITFLRDLVGEVYGNGAPFYYRVHKDQSITLLQYATGGVRLDFPYKDYPDAFPEAQALMFQLTDDVQMALRSLVHGEPDPDAYDIDAILGGANWHQIGGEPWLYVGPYIMPCPVCSESMPFLACVWDQCTDPRGFTGGSDAQVIFHTCANCFVVGVFESIN